MSKRIEELHTVPEVTCLAMTMRAKLFELDEQKFWIPNSQICNDEALAADKGEVCKLTLPAWLAKKVGLI